MHRTALLIVTLLWVAASPVSVAGVEVLGTIALVGPLHESADLSGVAVRGGVMFLVSDEDARIQILDEVEGQPAYRARDQPIALLDEDEEIDLEGLALRGETLFAVGSHSLLRRPLDEKAVVVHKPARDRLFRLRLDTSGQVQGTVQSVSLRTLLEHDPLLSPFCRIPGKENGVDIEGIAVAGNRLYLGLRSPVLRSGHVPVLVLPFDDPTAYELRLVDLGGLGIRGLDRVEGGFLVLAGSRRSDDDTTVYFWDGSDQVPGSDGVVTPAIRMGTVPSPDGAGGEGIALLRETTDHFDAIVVHDGSTTATLVRIARRP
jgi:hypothetical protein